MNQENDNKDLSENEQARVENIKSLRRLKRLISVNGVVKDPLTGMALGKSDLPDGVIIGNKNTRVFYNPRTGEIPIVYNNKDNVWTTRNGSMESLTNDGAYWQRNVPDLGQNIKSHVIAMVAMGEYDTDESLKLEVNHLNWEGTDNYYFNLELATRAQNIAHRNLKQKLIENNLWEDGMKVNAETAAKIMANWN
ncbi:MAG TPA: hypothetical protein DCP90_07900 [Clostridiales bacterium]|nr:MAG: hypothetical protein A2Y22_06095 [Clostridiales bacterium GWD2_32_59]HAN10522.1 hypothetical protein [Clostridiales bacterium]